MPAVELGGAHHAEQGEADERRTHFLGECSYRVRRFRDNELLTDIKAVFEKVMAELSTSGKLP